MSEVEGREKIGQKEKEGRIFTSSAKKPIFLKKILAQVEA